MHSIEIESQLKNLTQVESLIDQVCEDLRVSEDSYGNILIAVTEAVNNAIVHGNQNQPTKKVKVDVVKIDTGVIFMVMDEGKGFDFNNLPDPTAPENIERPDGRGIFLMKNLSDEVVFDLNGSKVNITFVADHGN
ncbi:ATP-binding protein [Crocinitomix catalasitica]|uniref:ATP-binding protein n=1 Tax=Crocinitomix catalasitica TaxID=184607 RepID=UPI0004850BC9|nr:ATP-binding protein [Crocinitomix catalasitica]|tara:strand:- start:271 stop:675 length:405 start_codon:yes stop_codon:yes gene_type:complete